MNYDIIRALRALGMPEHEIHKSTTNTQTYGFTAPAGVNTQTLQIPGTAAVLLGIVVDIDNSATVTDTFKMTLNNEALCADQLQVQCNRSSNTITRNGFFPFFRRMTGRDTLTVDYQSVAGSNVHFTIIYLTNYGSSARK